MRCASTLGDVKQRHADGKAADSATPTYARMRLAYVGVSQQVCKIAMCQYASMQHGQNWLGTETERRWSFADVPYLHLMCRLQYHSDPPAPIPTGGLLPGVLRH